MKLIMTMMVRDEADIIAPMIDHHLAQGVDTIIVTDNGSVDGTYEILQSYGDRIELKRDPVHRKQQHSVVTAMAREAYSRLGADWVINADADEFWLPADGGASLRDAFLNIPTSLMTFRVPVVDMTGAAALSGTGLQRLTLRDTRSLKRMNQVGVQAHSTPNAVHVGSDTVEVSQGNHAVNMQSTGEPPPGSGIEVLHYPWRSWEQFERKVRDAGKAYDNNPQLQPSPNHHGMREYRRWKVGSLLAFYALRHPTESEVSELSTGELKRDTRISDTVPSPVPDIPLDRETLLAAQTYGPVLSLIEENERRLVLERDARYAELLRYVDEGKQRIDELTADMHDLQADVAAAADRERALANELNDLRTRKIVRLADTIAAHVKNPTGRTD
jgi:glycosyltransferase involved in cell wall biosynthesis